MSSRALLENKMRVDELRAAFATASLRVVVAPALLHMYALPRRSTRVAHTFVLTDDAATAVAAPARRGRAAVRSYIASKPSQAAMKAFYSFMRTPVGKALAGKALAGKALAGKALAGKALAGTAVAGTAVAGTAVAGTAVAGTAVAGRGLAGGLAHDTPWVAPPDAPPAALAAYAALRATETPPPPLVAKVCLRRADENRVRRYAVWYRNVERPNRHEVARGITRVAHATPWTAAMHTDIDIALLR